MTSQIPFPPLVTNQSSYYKSDTWSSPSKPISLEISLCLSSLVSLKTCSRLQRVLCVSLSVLCRPCLLLVCVMPSQLDLYVFPDVKSKNNASQECLFDNTVFDHAPRNIENHITGHAQSLVAYSNNIHSSRLTIIITNLPEI
ncbi:hypothetical protein TNCV_311881 [Trichonephila clavipes]|nr:hypothetical protein TNCV_311881 [Trichonephila clavipes]